MDSFSNFGEDTIHREIIEVSFQLFKNHQKEFLDILLLAEIILSFSSSNSAIERVLSTLTTLLFDSRLRLEHETIEDCLLKVGNKNARAESNKEDILDSVVLKYFEKRHTMKIHVASLTSPKVMSVSISSDKEQ